MHCRLWRNFFMFLLLLISQHEMRQLVLRVNDVNLFTGSHHQYQVIILKRLKSVKVFLLFFSYFPRWYLPLGLRRFPIGGNAQICFCWALLLSRRLFWVIGQGRRSLLLQDLHESLEQRLVEHGSTAQYFSCFFLHPSPWTMNPSSPLRLQPS